MMIITLCVLGIFIMMFVSWAYKPIPVHLQIFIFMLMVLQISREIIEAINKKK